MVKIVMGSVGLEQCEDDEWAKSDAWVLTVRFSEHQEGQD